MRWFLVWFVAEDCIGLSIIGFWLQMNAHQEHAQRSSEVESGVSGCFTLNTFYYFFLNLVSLWIYLNFFYLNLNYISLWIFIVKRCYLLQNKRLTVCHFRWWFDCGHLSMYVTSLVLWCCLCLWFSFEWRRALDSLWPLRAAQNMSMVVCGKEKRSVLLSL